MPAGTAVKAAIEELRNALGALDRAIDMRFERERDSAEMELEIRRVHADRSQLFATDFDHRHKDTAELGAGDALW